MNNSLYIRQTDPVFLGIDGGGTKCRARIESADGEIVGAGMGGPANPALGVQRVVESILEATHIALLDAGLALADIDKLIAGVGVAGLHLPSYLQTMECWNHPFRQMFLFDDVYAACLGAHRGDDGAAVIAGTGFSALSIVRGRRLTVGGHGFLLGGDQCSGSWIGFEAVKAVLLHSDGLGPATLLTEQLQSKFHAQGLLLADALIGAAPRDYAALAPYVFAAAAQNDAVASTILRQSAAFIGRVVRLLMETRPPRISLLGGITGPIMEWLEPDIAALISSPLAPPEAGAIFCARSRWHGKPCIM